MKIIKEHFTSIRQMLSVIESRPNNKVMKGRKESEDGTLSFTGTRSYQEALDLFQNGYTDVLDQIKTGVDANVRKNQVVNRRQIRTNVVGYVPHVPNAILGLPNSMIMTEQRPQKIKAVSIVAGITENCGTPAEEFVKSGIAVLSLVNTLELRGFRVSLKLSFYNAQCGEELTWATICLKDYREHLDIQKLCFPLANPSMFRRFGFKWLETCPNLHASGWAHGYGSSRSDYNSAKQFLDENEYYIGLSLTKKCKYDVDKIISMLRIGQ